MRKYLCFMEKNDIILCKGQNFITFEDWIERNISKYFQNWGSRIMDFAFFLLFLFSKCFGYDHDDFYLKLCL